MIDARLKTAKLRDCIRKTFVRRWVSVTNVKYIDHGFQDNGAKEDKKAGMRIANSWQNDGLPWSMKLNAEKIYKP